jgi:uncharacterized short protein YbdD (DUF466 family)
MSANTQFQPRRAKTLHNAPLSSARARFKRFVRAFWRGLREWSGDSAYERYLHAPGAKNCECRTLTREEFYVEQLNRRYSRPNRCC